MIFDGHLLYKILKRGKNLLKYRNVFVYISKFQLLIGWVTSKLKIKYKVVFEVVLVFIKDYIYMNWQPALQKKNRLN